MSDRPSMERWERVAVDSVHSDGTVRLMRAARRSDRPPEDLGMDSWEPETEQVATTEVVEHLLREELQGRRLREGDVFFLEDGPAFFKGGGTEPIRPLRPMAESREMARREMKLEFAKLMVGQGIGDAPTREILYGLVEEAGRNRLSHKGRFLASQTGEEQP